MDSDQNRQKQTRNKRSKKYLLNTGVNLYNKYLLGGEKRTVTRHWDGLAAPSMSMGCPHVGEHLTAVVSTCPLRPYSELTCCIEEFFSWATFTLAPSYMVVPLLCFYVDITPTNLSIWKHFSNKR